MEPISTSTALLLGAGWFANKILGPSADELGSQLKAFIGDRTRHLVEGAEKKADPELAKPLSPAFFYNFSQKAAFSEDSDEINEMWSSLLADASEGQSYRHSLFADILTRIGAHEARYLSWFCKNADFLDGQIVKTSEIKSMVQHALAGSDKGVVDREEFSKKVMDDFNRLQFDWPVRFENARFQAQTAIVEQMSTGVTTVSTSDDLDFAIEVLKREDLIEPFEFELLFEWGNARVEGFRLTKIASEFYGACSREDRP